MLILGIAGGLNTADDHSRQPHDPGAFHDAASALLDGDRVVMAIENERITRLKHSCYFPLEAIRACLDQAGASIDDVDAFAWNWAVSRPERLRVLAERLASLGGRRTRARSLERRIVGVPHHLAHAMSAYAFSGFASSLLLALDARGGDFSGMAFVGQGPRITRLRGMSVEQSLGVYYSRFLPVLGFEAFDEYKLMGLAPYGDPARFRALFRTTYRLLPRGDFAIDSRAGLAEVARLVGRRRDGEPFAQVHKDVAAALQESLEELILHVAAHFRRETGRDALCLAGGVAHNCSANGKLLYSGLFRRVFVQPAAHDAGGAIGAALVHYYHRTRPRPRFRAHRLRHVYWGTAIGRSRDVERELDRWRAFIDVERPPDICRATAQLIAEGAVVGWMQGRSEFGPRALGNRSILADPRPAENRDRINAMVKKREAYRPFAPAVCEEALAEYFETPAGLRSLPFMVFVVRVRPERRALLGAVTHVDGTARVQSVARATNPRFWGLLKAFGELTGVPVLLNTSFNNSAEPIVDTPRDGIACFLTSGLDCLVIGDRVIRKAPAPPTDYLGLCCELPRHLRIAEVVASRRGGRTARHAIRNHYVLDARWCPAERASRHEVAISDGLYRILALASPGTPMRELLDRSGDSIDRHALTDEVLALWTRRLLRLQPPE